MKHKFKISKKLLSVFLAILMLITAIPFSGVLIASAATGNASLTNNQHVIVVGQNSANRYSNGYMTLVSDGEIGNTAACMWRYDLSPINSSYTIDNATVSFKIAKIGTAADNLAIKFYCVTEGDIEHYLSWADEINAHNYNDDKLSNYNNMVNTLGLSESNVIYTLNRSNITHQYSSVTDASSYGTYSMNISSQLQNALSFGNDKIYIIAMFNRATNSNERWSDTGFASSSTINYTYTRPDFSNADEAIGIIKYDPIIYTKGNDFMAEGSTICTGSESLENKTSYQMGYGYKIEDITIEEGGSPSDAITVSDPASSGILRGTIAGTNASTSKMIKIKTSFTRLADHKPFVQYDKLYVVTNPVPSHGVVGAYCWKTGVGSSYHAYIGYSMVAENSIASYGDGSANKDGGGSSDSAALQGNALKKVISNAMSVTFPDDIVGGTGNIFISRPTKQAGWYAVRKNGGFATNTAAHPTVTAPTANYYFDKSYSKNTGISYYKGDSSYSIKFSYLPQRVDPSEGEIVVDNVWLSGNNFTKTDLYSTSRTASSGSKQTITVTGTDLSVGTKTGTVSMREVSGLIQSGATSGIINIPFSITIIDKGSLRGIFDEYIAEKPFSTCYDHTKWTAYRTALVNAQEYLNNYTNYNEATQNNLANTLKRTHDEVMASRSEDPSSHRLKKIGTVVASCDTASTENYECADKCGFTYVTHDTAPTGHTFVEHEGKAATCRKSGYEAYQTCRDCDFTNKVVIPPLNHPESERKIVGQKTATCTSEGYTGDEICGLCGFVMKKGEATETVEHNFVSFGEAKAPTCEEEGSTEGIKCSVCGLIEEIPTVIPKTPHTPKIVPDQPRYFVCTNPECGFISKAGFSECPKCASPVTYDSAWIIETKNLPTCNNEGLVYKQCSVCDQVYDAKALDRTEHSFVTDDGKAPSCEDMGYNEVHCTICGKVVLDEYVTALGHELEETVIKAASCTEAGSSRFTCINCDFEETVEIPAYGHREVIDTPAKAPSCTEAGCTKGSHCDRCSEILSVSEPVAQLEHRIRILPSREATCTVNGITEGKKCTTCGQTIVEQKVLTAPGHDEVILPETEPTCTEKGLSAGKKCNRCGEILVAQYEEPANGHTVVIDEAKPATCTESGLTQGSHCSVCHIKIREQKTVQAKGHVTVTDPAKPATCTETGLTKGIHCSVCGEVLVAQTETPTISHSYGGWTVKSNPTCSSTGEKTRNCLRCGELETQEIAKLTHKEVIIPAIESTCSETGLTVGKKCSICGEIFKPQEVTAKKDHVASDWIVDSKATCHEAGSKHKECTVCGTVLTTVSIAQLSHSYVQAITPPTCQAKGYTTFTCAYCGDSYVKNYTEKVDHSPLPAVRENVIDSTCIEPGSCNLVEHCKYCNEVLSSVPVTIAKRNHEDKDSDGHCDECLIEMGNPAGPNTPDKPSDDTCNCICHRAENSAFVRFFYSFIRAIWKLFNSNQYCDCGVAHY